MAMTNGHSRHSTTKLRPMAGEIFGHHLIGRDPRVPKSNRFHVVIFFRFFFEFYVYSIHYSMIYDRFVSCSLELQPIISQTRLAHL